MNCDTGELIRLMKGQEPPEGFAPVPDKLSEEANKELAGRDSVMVDMTKDTPLTGWAKKQQKKRKARSKMARASRRRNRK